MKCWTDYPFTQLGDMPGKIAPVREVEALEFDGDKYLLIGVFCDDGEYFTAEIKAGYVYQQEGRFGDVPRLTDDQLASLVPNAELTGGPDASDKGDD